MTRKIVQILVHCLVSCLAAKRQVRQRDKRRIRYLVSKSANNIAFGYCLFTDMYIKHDGCMDDGAFNPERL